MRRMTENTRPVPGNSAPRDASLGEQRRSPGSGASGSGGSKRRRRRGRGKGRSGAAQAAGQAGQQGSQKSRSEKSGAEKSGESKRGSAKQSTSKQGAGKQGASKQGAGKSSQQRRRRGRGRGGSNRPNQHRSHEQRRKPQYQQRFDLAIDTRDETSAGGLVVSGMAEAVGSNGHVDLSRIYTALIGRLDRRGRLLWSMPKGHVEDGEHQWRTAEREVWEETGIYGEAFDTLGTIDYWFVSDGVRIHKTVHHNLLRYVDGVFNDEDPEVTEVAWVPMNELIERLAYADERKLARIAVDRMPDLARKEAEAGRATPR
mgnify:CR=1 FL=1